MELRQLQCLIICAQTKSFSKAASHLFTSQSNVSKMISALENELGKKLFERKQYGIELTSKGKQIYQYAVGMVEFKDKILNCADEEELETLRVSYQSSSWFAEAFCEFYQENSDAEYRYHVTAVALKGIISRLNFEQDQLGFAYIEEEQMNKMEEVFHSNHISYYKLKETKQVLYGTNLAKIDENNEVLLVQGNDDYYAGQSSWKTRIAGREEDTRMRVVINTNSDAILNRILQSSGLGNISPEYMSHREKTLAPGNIHQNIVSLQDEKKFYYVCMFRNDRKMERLPKAFLSFIRKYLRE